MAIENPIILEDASPESDIVKKLLYDLLGRSAVTTVSDIDKLLQLIQENKNYGICILCCPDFFSGVALTLNRIKSLEELSLLPILLIPGQGGHDAINLITEYPCTIALPKPASALQISKALTLLSREAEWYTENIPSIESSIRKIEKASDLTEVKTTLESSTGHGTALGFIFAELAAKHNILNLAEIAYRWILSKDQNNLRAIAGLGRSLFLLDKSDEAAAYLRIARRQSRANIERLCMLGEIAIKDGKMRHASRSFTEAKTIDPDNHRIQAGLDVISNFEQSVAFRAGQGLAHSLIQTYNIVAISHVQDRKMDSAIGIYKGALKISSEPKVKARIEFNIGLCYLKFGKNADATIWFKKSLETGHNLFTRAQQYLDKLSGKISPSIQSGDDTWTEIVTEEPKGTPNPTPSPAAKPAPPSTPTLTYDESEFVEESL
jgi:tetratricopeptide (TPR) repeat protein